MTDDTAARIAEQLILHALAVADHDTDATTAAAIELDALLRVPC